MDWQESWDRMEEAERRNRDLGEAPEKGEDMDARCGLEDCDCRYIIDKLLAALEEVTDCHIRSVTKEAWELARAAIKLAKK